MGYNMKGSTVVYYFTLTCLVIAAMTAPIQDPHSKSMHTEAEVEAAEEKAAQIVISHADPHKAAVVKGGFVDDTIPETTLTISKTKSNRRLEDPQKVKHQVAVGKDQPTKRDAAPMQAASTNSDAPPVGVDPDGWKRDRDSLTETKSSGGESSSFPKSATLLTVLATLWFTA